MTASSSSCKDNNMIVNEYIKKADAPKTGYIVKCINCDNEIYIIKSKFENKKNSSFKEYFACSKHCTYSKIGMELQKQKMKQKYGYINSFQSKKVKDKIKQTNLKRYGVDNPWKSEIIKNKIQETKNLILDNGSTINKMIGKKAYETRIKKYGTNNLLGAVPKQKTIKTNNKKYGCDYYFQSDIGKMNLNGYILRYGKIDGLNKYLEKNKHCAITLDNLTAKYGKEDAIIRYNNWKNKVAVTLDKFIIKYGEELGHKKYEQWFLSSIGKPSSGQISNISKQFFAEIENKFNLILTSKNYEFYKFDKINNKRYFYDFIYNDKIIEFNGDYWHANPFLYKEKDLIKLRGAEVVEAKSLWDKDEIKYNFIRKSGFNILIVWEYDYKNNKINYNKIKEFLEC